MYLPTRRLNGLGVVTLTPQQRQEGITAAWLPGGSSRSFGPRLWQGTSVTPAQPTTGEAGPPQLLPRHRRQQPTQPTQAATVTTASQSAATGYIVPVGTPLNVQFPDPSGNVWAFNPTSGQWGLTITSTAGLLPSSSTIAATDPNAAVTAAPSSYQSILDWLTEQTLIGGIPNWVIGAGAVFAYTWISKRGR